MSTITKNQEKAILDLVQNMELPSGLGNEKNACSVAAINLALNGKLTDEIPKCMSFVLGQWLIVTQDAISKEERNSPEWKALLPLAAGTGREHETERLNIIINEMWDALGRMNVPPDLTLVWNRMLKKRTYKAAHAAAKAALEKAKAEGGAARAAAHYAAARAADGAARAAHYAANAAAHHAANAAARAAANAARAAARATETLHKLVII